MFKWIKNWRSGSTRAALQVTNPSQDKVRDGNALLARGDLQGAAQSYRQATHADQENAIAYVNLGYVLLELGQKDEALAALNTALAKQPDNPDCHYLIGNLAESVLDLGTASRHYRRALDLKPDFEMACLGACRALSLLGEFSNARALVARGLAMNPKSAEFHFYEGNLFLAAEDWDSALSSFQMALALGADYPALHGHLGGAFLKKNQLGAALKHLTRAVELDPGNMEAHHDIGVVWLRLGDVERGIQHQMQVIAHEPDQLHAHSCLLFALCSSIQCTPQAYAQAAAHFSEQVRKTVKPGLSSTSQTASRLATGKSLRIGWVSGDFRKHVNIAFFLHLIERLALTSLELVAFSNNPYDDGVTNHLRKLIPQWHDIAALSDADAAQLIRSCRIDVLIDLSGHSAHNRLAVFAWKPAPVQVSWLGYFASTGLREIDYLLADEVSLPLEDQRHYSERIWHLPHTRLCMAAPGELVAYPVSPLPALSAGHITFGNFQALSKINDSVLRVWSRILAGIPDARLRLQIRYLEQANVREELCRRMQDAGISMNRVTLLGGVLVDAYFEAHHAVDLILDTFPYPGGTTTAEALWMGVPTVTLNGQTLLARQGAGMLHNAGLPDWVATDEDDYVDRAIRLASDTAALANLRGQLRRQVLASPLFDCDLFAKHFQKALYDMVEDASNRHLQNFSTSTAK